MFTKDFLKKISELKQEYVSFQPMNPLKFQSLLRKNIKNDEISTLLAELIFNEKKYENKFPNLIQSGGILWGDVCEQATSELIAEHKANFFYGHHFLDLTAGLAIDAMAFAQHFAYVTAIETNASSIPILTFNAEKLKFHNIHFIHDTAENFLIHNTSHFDLIYIDPSRKNHQKKVFHPKDCSPNIFTILPQLLLRTKKVLIKLSPMIEISELNQWFENIEWIWVISQNNDCKELLVLINSEYKKSPQLRLSIFNKSDVHVYEFHSITTKEQSINPNLYDYQWILIPDVAFVKTHTLTQLQEITQGFLTSTHDGILLLFEKPNNFFGRIKRILKIMNLNEWEQYQKHNQLWKAQVIKKNFPLKVEEIRKKWKILDGNKDCLIFFKIEHSSFVAHCSNVQE